MRILDHIDMVALAPWALFVDSREMIPPLKRPSLMTLFLLQRVFLRLLHIL